MGAVYRAVQISIDRTVAVKLLAAKYSADSVFVERFLREARAAARLNHPNIVQAIDVGEADGHYYFVMEFVEGHTLADMLKERGRIPVSEALDIIKQIARALENAGRFNMLHLDVKPPNILIAANGAAKLGDFGLARHVEDEDTIYASRKVIFGTPCYMSPEQVKGVTDLDCRTDVWSLGVTFYEIVTGRNPFAAADQKATLRNVRSGNVPAAHEVEPSVPENVGKVIAKTMAQARDERYGDPATLLVDLDALSRNQPPPIALKLPLGASQTPKPEPAKSGSRMALVVAVALVAVLASAAVTMTLLDIVPGSGRVPGNGRPPPVLPPDENDPVARRFRECVGTAEQARLTENFAKAIAAYEAFAEEHEGSKWAEQARIAARDVREQAVGKARTISQAAAAAVNKKDFAAAEGHIAKIEELGLPDTQRVAAAARQQLEEARQAVAAEAEKARAAAAAAAYNRLQETLERLSAEEKFTEALSQCNVFLANPDFGSWHDTVRTRQARLALMRDAQKAILAGARKSTGTALQSNSGKATITGVKDPSITVRVKGAARSMKLAELAASDLRRLLLRAGPETVRTRTGLAVLLQTQKRFSDALSHATALRFRAQGDLQPVVQAVERDCMLGAAPELIDSGRPHEAIDLLRRFRRQYARAERQFYESQRTAVAKTFERARAAIYSEMRPVYSGAFVYKRNSRAHLPLYYMDTHEVTNREYARFLEDIAKAGARRHEHAGQPAEKKDHVPLDWDKLSRGRPDHPVVGVDWYDAYAYARWCGKRLPTEREWEKAARGRSGSKYPWGDSWKNDVCNSRPAVVISRSNLPSSVVAVGRFTRGNSPYGCADMAGNVREWTQTELKARSPQDLAVVRGGSYKDPAASCSTTSRLMLSKLTRDDATGFRCAMGPIRGSM